MIKYLVLIFLIYNTNIFYSQTNQHLIKQKAPSVFINCGFCDLNFIKEKIPIVNFVNDRIDSDINILFTSERTGSGGNEYTLLFYGQKKYEGKNDTIKFFTQPNEPENNLREKTIEALKFGLIQYLIKSDVADNIIISFKEPEQVNEKAEDSWDFWVFKTSLSGFFNGEKMLNYYYLNGSISASRVTEASKFLIRLNGSYNENNFKVDLEDEIINYKSLSRNFNFYAHNYFSINEHWSWGISTNFYKSTYRNIDLSGSLSPQIEYNFFSYSESNKKQLRLNYIISPTYNIYSIETIYFKTKETLLSQELSATLALIEQWGNTSISVSGSNFFHDMNKYELQIYANISWQLFKGLSLDLNGGYSKIKNQISLAKGNASLEEVLLQRRQLETGYSVWASIGLSFSFGSIYNNIVNPRFGN